MTIEQAKQYIITLGTLPPQIDYIEQYERRAIKAIRFINDLPENLRRSIYAEIDEVVNAYYEPNEDGVSVAYLDSLF